MDEIKRPNVLIFGGTGFIGRNLVHYLVTNKFTNKICVADKVSPIMAWLNSDHKKSMEFVEFKQVNLINAASIEKAFARNDGLSYDFIVNCAAETKLEQSECVYKEGICSLTQNIVNYAVTYRPSLFIHISSGLVYRKSNATEESPINPWTTNGSFTVTAEKLVTSEVGLNWVVFRPVITYGIADRSSITQRLIIGAIYKKLDESMKVMWSENLQLNTVHVLDVCRAVWHACTNQLTHQIFNLCDRGETTHGVLCQLVGEIFDVEYSFLGNFFSNVARLRWKDVVQDVNEKHLQPWSNLCTESEISHTFLSPHLCSQQLLDKPISVDGTKIESTGFEYYYPQITKELLLEIVRDFVAMKAFPPIVKN